MSFIPGYKQDLLIVRKDMYSGGKNVESISVLTCFQANTYAEFTVQYNCACSVIIVNAQY
jgi:hypothetical protein